MCDIIRAVNNYRKVIVFLLFGIVIASLSYALYRLYVQNQALETAVTNLEGTLETTEKNLAEVTQNSVSLLDALSAEQQKSGFLFEQASTFAVAVQRLSGTVTELEKLSKTDPELLIKYSKVYFLNEHYTPEKLTLIPKDYVYLGKEEYFHARAFPYLEILLRQAKDAGVEVQLISAFRSFETQTDLKSKYKVTYGSGANTFSAEQGYSEHQLGTTVDLTTPPLGASFEKFDSTSSFMWLTQNAHKYGFVLSYPKGNAYYIYEPWHWRFVGVELATRLYSEGKQFYDMDQRDLNEYLVKIFD